MAFLDMYTKCYNPVFLGEKNRQIILALKTGKKQVEDRLGKSEKKVKDLETDLKEVREKKEGARKALEEERQGWEDAIKVMIEAKNIRFKLKKKKACQWHWGCQGWGQVCQN